MRSFLHSIRERIAVLLPSNIGETLVETLVAILIGALSVAMLLGATISSGTLNKKAEAISDEVREQKDAAVAKTTTGDSEAGSIVVSYADSPSAGSDTYSVQFYGGSEMAAYGVISGPEG